MKKVCKVVFPLYRQPTVIELAFLENGMRVLKNFDMAIACPQSLEVNEHFGELSALPLVRFGDHYFNSIEGYNQLMLSEEFYSSFAAYEHILIHQADVFIFKDELQFWCNKGYAYIGPPWLRKPDRTIKKLFNYLRKLVQPGYGVKHNLVGNGGFSLRHVQKHLNVLHTAPATTLELYRMNTHHLYNEDVFWSLEAPNVNSDFTIPDAQEAIRFGIEFKPGYALQILDQQLPFGCHAPFKHEPEVWKQHIPAME